MALPRRPESQLESSWLLRQQEDYLDWLENHPSRSIGLKQVRRLCFAGQAVHPGHWLMVAIAAVGMIAGLPRF
jgi:hypothetical protein